MLREMPRRTSVLLAMAVLCCCLATGARAEPVGWRHDCAATAIGGDDILADDSGSQTYDVEPNVPETTGYDLKNVVNQLRFGTAGGTYAATLSCTVTVDGVSVPATRAISLAVDTPGPGTRRHIFTLEAKSVTVPLPGGASFVATMPEITDGSSSVMGDVLLIVPNQQTDIVLRRPPLPVTGAASGVTATTATLGATVDPRNLGATVHFAYGPAGGPLSAVTPDQAIAAGSGAVAVSAPVTGLAPGTAYSYRLVASNAVGMADPAAAVDFATAAAPVVAPAAEPVAATPAPVLATPPAAEPPPAPATPPAAPAISQSAAPLPVLLAAKAITLPSAKRCLSRRSFPIHLRLPSGVRAKSARIAIDGHARPTLTGAALTSRIDLRGLPKGRFTVTVRVTTTDGQTITQQRTYRTCASKSAKR
jgi:hypothetical protein